MVMEAVQEFMDELFDDAEELGSGKYTRYSKHLQSINEQVEDVKDRARYAMAAEMLVAHPGSVNTMPVFKHTRKQEFMREVVMLKCAELAKSVVAHDKRLTAAMAVAWQRALVLEFLDEESAETKPAGYTKLRYGIASLFAMRVGMLDHVVGRLDDLVVDPRSLFPEAWGDAPQPGDLGGPTAAELVAMEPRFLRWIMYLPPDCPWPRKPEMYPTGCRSAEHPMRSLAAKAAAAGGDDPTINDPCTCPRCGGVGLPRNRGQGKRPRTWEEREYWSIVRDSIDDAMEERVCREEGVEEEEGEGERCRKTRWTAADLVLDEDDWALVAVNVPPAPRRAVTA